MTDSSSVDGAQLYEGACAKCHQPNGKGTADQFYPSLTHNSAVGDVRQGGPAPLLIKAMPYLLAAGAIIGVLILLLIVRVLRNRKA